MCRYTVAAMSVDMGSGQRRRVPGPVLAAAILLGVFGGLFGLALLLLGLLQIGITGAAPAMMVLGLLIATAVTLAIIGLARGNRGAQIATTVIGGLGFLGSLYTLSQGQAISILWLACGAAIVLLAVVPVSSRDWFSR